MHNAIHSWKPNEKQMAFLNDTDKMKAAICANWTGKTTMLAFETACHLTGDYPDWWTGVRFDKSINAVVVGANALFVRDTIQKKIIEFIGDRLEYVEMRPGIPDAIDRLWVKRKGGATSVVFKNNEMCPTSFQMGKVDFAAIDEQVRPEFLIETRFRTAITDGYLATAFTPFDHDYYNIFGEEAHNIAMSDCDWIDAGKVIKSVEWIPQREIRPRVYGTLGGA